ncbi:MAG: hypothetical protein K2L12_06240, partial [Clostridia bacterium]|nr:hypothetical protein [Clostridia bacterium]
EPEYEEQEEEVVEEDYTALSTAIADEVEKRVNSRLEGLEENVAKINEAIAAEPEYEEQEEEVVEEDYTALSTAVADEVEKRVNSRLDSVEEKISTILANGIVAAEAAAAAQSAAAEEELSEEEPLVTVSDIVEDIPEETEEEIEELQEVEEAAPLTTTAKAPLQSAAVSPEEEEFAEEEEEPDEEDFLIDVLDMDAFSDDELMPGEGADYHDGVDFENMMKFKRSFIARIIQSNDEYKQYYGEVKHALLSYRKVNSNVAWGAERFNKGRETIARMKIRGKTLCLYLALDPNEYKTSVYHHIDVSDNKSVAGTPMMVKVKSNLGVKKAIRLIDEMLAKRNGEKKEIPERDYAAMYPYETIEELIDDGLVKDVRKK